MMSQLVRECLLSVLRTHYVHRCGRVRLLFVAAAMGCAAPVLVSSPAPSPTAPVLRSTDYQRLEAEVLAALNRARTDPEGTAASLDAMTKYYTGKLLQRPGQSVPIQTNEGVTAVREAASA